MTLYLNNDEAKALLKALDDPSTTSLTLAHIYERLRAQVEFERTRAEREKKSKKTNPWGHTSAPW